MDVDGAYVALDVLSPHERFRRVLEDCMRAEELCSIPIVFMVQLTIVAVKSVTSAHLDSLRVYDCTFLSIHFLTSLSERIFMFGIVGLLSSIHRSGPNSPSRQSVLVPNRACSLHFLTADNRDRC